MALEEEVVETPVDEHGFKERTRILIGKNGRKQRVTERVKVETVMTKVLRRIKDRENLPKFGEAAKSNQYVTQQEPKYVKIEHPDEQLAELTQDSQQGFINSFVERNQLRQMEREHGLSHVPTDEEAAAAAAAGGGDAPGPGGPPDKYVPPGARAGGAAGATMPGAAGGASEGNEMTIRVSNLTKNATEDDLRDLFGRFGRIARCSVPRVEKTKEVRGFAYISYYTRAEAEAAMNTLQGHGYDHLILRLEWAKERAPRADGGGGGDGFRAHRSGYGTKLAQDTTQRVSYASNLTENR